MGLAKGQKQMLRYTYDFDRDGGAIGQVSLKPDANSIGDDYIVCDVLVHELEALTSGGTPALTLGNSNDLDGYLADFEALSGSAGNVYGVGEVAGALLWDDTNDHRLQYNVGSVADNQDIVLDIGTAALTGGKLSVYVEVMPLF